uniref:SCAN box domain-containing protein n=1 Tax=Pygocentrus nattereri TaxID=42514 RepID=A0AAR2LYD1_PYGNA
MTEQKGRDDYLQKEAAKQELRWRSMQHQFGLLQEEVHKGRAEGRRKQDQSEETTDFAHTQILRCTQAGSADQINESETRHFTSQVSSHTAETPRELYTRLKGVYEKWMAPQEKSKEEISDEIVLEQYLQMVRPELRRWIIERSPGSTLQAVEMAEAFVAARQPEGNFRFDEVNQPRQHVELSLSGGGVVVLCRNIVDHPHRGARAQ